MAVGVKVTLAVQVAFFARDTLRQVLVCAKSVAADPVKERAVISIGAVPVVLKVTSCAGLGLPTVEAAKLSVPGEVPYVVRVDPAVTRGICQMPRP